MKSSLTCFKSKQALVFILGSIILLFGASVSAIALIVCQQITGCGSSGPLDALLADLIKIMIKLVLILIEGCLLEI